MWQSRAVTEWEKTHMSDLVAIAYPDVDTARRAAANALEAQKSHVLELADLVVVERKPDGKVKLHQPSAAGVGAAGGAVWGGLIGLLFLAPLLGMAAGAATGALAGTGRDWGVDDDFMRQLGSRLDDGRSALVLLVSKVTPDKILPEIKIQGELLQSSLSNEAEEALREALEAAPAA